MLRKAIFFYPGGEYAAVLKLSKTYLISNSNSKLRIQRKDAHRVSFWNLGTEHLEQKFHSEMPKR